MLHMSCLCLPYFTNYDLIWGHILNKCHQLWIVKQTWVFHLCPTKMSYLRYWSLVRLLCKNQKLRIPIFMVYKAPGVQLTKIRVLRRKFVMKSMTNLLIQIRICFSSFTLLYFVSKVLTQMQWAESYTHGCMYKLILYMIFLILLLFFVYPDFF